MSFVLVVRMKALAGKEEEAVAAARALAQATRNEPGNELYVPVQETENPGSILIFEQYADKAAFEAHGASDHFKELALEGLFTLVEDGRERTFYETI